MGIWILRLPGTRDGITWFFRLGFQALGGKFGRTKDYLEGKALIIPGA